MPFLSPFVCVSWGPSSLILCTIVTCLTFSDSFISLPIIHLLISTLLVSKNTTCKRWVYQIFQVSPYLNIFFFFSNQTLSMFNMKRLTYTLVPHGIWICSPIWGQGEKYSFSLLNIWSLWTYPWDILFIFFLFKITIGVYWILWIDRLTTVNPKCLNELLDSFRWNSVPGQAWFVEMNFTVAPLESGR